jgi:membrane-bound lytic murein transglycosylase D
MSGAPRAPKGNVLDVKESITDSNIVFPESFETDTQKLLESWYMKNYTATDDKYLSSDVKTTDDQIRQRLSQLPTVIEMPFNSIVRTYIDRYTQRGRAQVAATLGLANYYMPIFEQALEEAGLPLELKYLPVVESALNPNAVSKHGATGLWQFMLATGKGLGMEVNSLVDERRDPYVSSRKAARYLKDLHSTYGDWSLAIAAYNCGPGAVNKAVRRAGDGKHDFWSIYEYLSPETRGYVPAFIAANYVMNYYPEHGISPVIPTKPLVTDTVGVAGRVHFNQISEVLDIPVEELRLLNPQFRADLIPGSPEKPYMLILPSQQVHAYIVSEDQIKGHEAERYARRDVVEPGDMPSESSVEMEMADPSAADVRQTIAADNLPAEEPARPARQTPAAGKPATHKVAAGETLASIAALYGVTPAEVKRWNNLRRNSVRVGQQLRVAVDAQAETSVSADSSVPASRQQVSPAKAKRQSKSASSSKKGKKGRKEAKPTQHSIKNGENLTVIAKKYGVSVDEIKRANNMKDDDIRAGKSIKIPSKGTSKKKTASKRKNKKRRR